MLGLHNWPKKVGSPLAKGKDGKAINFGEELQIAAAFSLLRNMYHIPTFEDAYSASACMNPGGPYFGLLKFVDRCLHISVKSRSNNGTCRTPNYAAKLCGWSDRSWLLRNNFPSWKTICTAKHGCSQTSANTLPF